MDEPSCPWMDVFKSLTIRGTTLSKWVALGCIVEGCDFVIVFVGFRVLAAMSMIVTVPASRLGPCLHLRRSVVSVELRRVLWLKWKWSLMRSQGIWCPGFGVLRSGGGARVGRVWSARRGMMGCVGVPILDQYLIREMVPALALAVGICASLGMSLGALVGLVREVAVSGLPLRVAGAAAMLQLPYFAAASMPMACLAASLFGLGRLHSDMESVALFAAGVPLWRMLLTPVCLCLVGAILKLACHNCVVPYGSSQARKMVETALTTHMQGLRQTDDLIYQEYGAREEMGADGIRTPSRWSYGLQRIWYASQLEGTRLTGLLLLEVSPSGYVHRVVVGDAAEWQMNESTWNFSNSTVVDVSPVGDKLRILQVDGLRVPSSPLTSGRALWKRRTLDELPRSEIAHEINSLATRQRLEGSAYPANGTRNLVIDADILNKLDCFLCQRDAAAFSCVVYGLIGAVATLAQSGRGSRSVSRATPFAWAIVASLIYNTVAAAAGALGSTKALTPWLSAWLPPLLALATLAAILAHDELQPQSCFRANKLDLNSNLSTNKISGCRKQWKRKRINLTRSGPMDVRTRPSGAHLHNLAREKVSRYSRCFLCPPRRCEWSCTAKDAFKAKDAVSTSPAKDGQMLRRTQPYQLGGEDTPEGRHMEGPIIRDLGF